MNFYDSITSDMTWAMNRIENRFKPFNPNPVLGTLNALQDVEVYVMDSGIASHDELTNASIENFFKLDQFDSFVDNKGHGTGLTSLIVGKTFGVNPNAKIKNVKIFDTNQVTSALDIINALRAILNAQQANPSVQKIAMCAWTLPWDQDVAQQITELVNAGVIVVAAAGNAPAQIDALVPAGVPGVITVAASSKLDVELFTVFGVNKRLDFYAPGEEVGMAAIGDHPYKTASGSSASTALVAGVMSLAASGFKGPGAQAIIDAVKKDATALVINANEKVSAAENKLIHKIDATSLDANSAFFGGKLITSSNLTDRKFSFNLNSIFDFYYNLKSSNTVTEAAVFEGAASAFSGCVTFDTDLVVFTLPDGYTLSGDDEVNEYSFKVTLATDSMTYTSPEIFFLVASETTKPETLSQAVDQLSDKKYDMSVLSLCDNYHFK